MSDMNMKIRIKFEIGDIKFEAEGSADLVERERAFFTNTLLPSAVEAIARTRGRSQAFPYVEPAEQSAQLLAQEKTVKNTCFLDERYDEDYSQMSLASFLKKYGPLTEQDFALFSAYFDERKNSTPYFTKDDLEKYYDEARRTKPSNISMSLNRLAEKGFIMDVTDVEQKMPKPYRISSDGIKYIYTYKPKEEKEKRVSGTKSRTKSRTKSKSDYEGVNCDELNLDKYPNVKSLKDFKEKMMMILYIITKEGKGEWFTVADVLYLLTDVFGEAASKGQVNGVFKREKLWFKAEKVEGNNKVVKRKLLNKGMEFAQSLIGDNQNEQEV